MQPALYQSLEKEIVNTVYKLGKYADILSASNTAKFFKWDVSESNSIQ